ncbi:MAG: hypothetical protein L6R36_001543 [Xanthoria steineri]|nr:MAG: hypothetical protein L6R36_001543 [Xanthoria steineri]
MSTFRSAILLAFSLTARIACAENNASVRIPASFNPTVAGLNRVQYELGPQLSPAARIYLPGNAFYGEATTRWNGAMHPDFAAVVVPINNEDVATAVRYANKQSLPFLTVNRGLGSSTDLNTLRHGISIYLDNFDSITIASDGQSAILGGGVSADQLIKALAAKGKVAATTAVTCVGVVGAGLGGGMGMYQGLYGLVADNFLEMTIVTADGSTVTANERQNADLFWAMRGAGHNFGIVTSYVYKIYDNIPTWYVASYQYTHDKIDAVFMELDKLKNGGKQPKELTVYTVFASNPSISNEPVIILSIWYAGPSSSAVRYAQPFLNLGPALLTNQTVPYANLADAVGIGIQGPFCQSGMSHASFPVGVQKLNTIHQVYDLYTDLITKHPEFQGSFVQIEAYPMQGVQAVGGGNTAYAHRGDNLLVSLFHAGDAPGRPLNTYVNYAYGDETLEQVYGHEEWRIRKLKTLKKQWEPHGRFNYFHPIL